MAESNVKRVANGKYPPQKTSYLWLDTSNPAIPILKEFSDGSWITYSGGGGGGGDTDTIINAIRGANRDATTTAIYTKLGDMTVLIENVDDLIATIIDSQTSTLKNWVTDKTTEIKNYVNTRAGVTDGKVDEANTKLDNIIPIILEDNAALALVNELTTSKRDIVYTIRHMGGKSEENHSLSQMATDIGTIPQPLFTNIVEEMVDDPVIAGWMQPYERDLAVARAFRNDTPGEDKTIYPGYNGYFVCFINKPTWEGSVQTIPFINADAVLLSDGTFYDDTSSEYTSKTIAHVWDYEKVLRNSNGMYYIVYLYYAENYIANGTVSSLGLRTMIAGGTPSSFTINGGTFKAFMTAMNIPSCSFWYPGTVEFLYIDCDNLTFISGGNGYLAARSAVLKAINIEGNSVDTCAFNYALKFISTKNIYHFNINCDNSLQELDFTGVEYLEIYVTNRHSLNTFIVDSTLEEFSFGVHATSLYSIDYMRNLKYPKTYGYDGSEFCDSPYIDTPNVVLPNLLSWHTGNTAGNYYVKLFKDVHNLESVTLANWDPPEVIGGAVKSPEFLNCPNLKEIHVPSQRYCTYLSPFLQNCPALEILDAPLLKSLGSRGGGGDYDTYYQCLRNSVNLHTVILSPSCNFNGCFNGCIKLIHLEYSSTVTGNKNITGWEPSEAMDSTISTLVEPGESFNSNLEKFLYNFEHYIVDRLADRTGTSALTLTLNTAVYNVLTPSILSNIAAKNWSIIQV